MSDSALTRVQEEGDVPKQDRKHLLQRHGIWHYYRRVPKRFQSVDSRTFHEESMGVREHRHALRSRVKFADAIEKLWISLLNQDSDNPHEKYEAAIERARLEGFPYRSAEQIAKGPLEDLVARIERLNAIGVDDAGATAALLGGRNVPQITLSEALEKFFDYSRDRQRRYSPDQLRKYKTKRSNAIANLIAVAGDKAIGDMTRDDTLAFRDWWLARVEADEVKANAANKNFSHAAEVIRTVSEKLDLGLPDLFQKLRLDENDGGTRPAFETSWIVERLLADGALDGLNSEARGILLVIVETGLRPVELCNGFPQDIKLTHNVPHFHVRDIDENNVRRPRRMKTAQSERKIPLVGVSLEAMRQFPNGFPTYLDKPSSLSACVNRYLRENGLLPTERHTLYSLRHSFQERLNAVETPERLDCELMGHKFSREKYGDISLEQKRDHLVKIAVSVPRQTTH